MSKSDEKLENIDLSKSFSPPHNAKFTEDKDINGFDTETADGNIFALSYSWDNGETDVIYDSEFLDSSDIFDLITHGNARSALNMWYNLDFDANVILKHVLDKEQLAVIITSGTVETENYVITYIPSKFLKIKDKHGNIYTHYDASQFFFDTLDNAVGEWLGESKLSENTDVTKFGTKEGGVNEYIENNIYEILEYARKDAKLVRDLWKEAVSVGELLDIPMGMPFSTGYLAESYLNHKLQEKPGLGNRNMSKMAWESYAGGRFEVLKRGNIGKVVGPDINSAYPHILSQLPDPKTLEWQHITNPNIPHIEKADYGFLDITVTTDKSRPIQPFGVKMRDSSTEKLKYPALDSHRLTVVKDIFVNALKYDYIEDFEVHNSWLGFETDGTVFPFQFVNSLYEKRKEFESNGKMKKGKLLKIVLNSMYGKMCQTTPKRTKVEGNITLGNGQYYVSPLSLPKTIREGYENGFVETLESGAWFNPFIGSYITGLTRLELHKQILNYGLEDNAVMLATDSIMLEKEAFDKTNFRQDLVKDGLGNWDIEYVGNAFVVGAGVYQVDYENGDSKVKTRGFNENDLEGTLVDESVRANGHIEIESLRPKSAAEAIWQNRKVSEIGEFMEHSKELTADFDTNRDWPESVGYSDLLRNVQESKPLTV